MLRRRTAGMLAASTVTLVASMALSGCGPDNPAPKPFNPPKAASSSSSVDAVPQMPDEAKQNNAAGAKAFMRYFVRVLNYAAHTGDVTELDRLSAPDCLNCTRSIDVTMRIYKAGGSISGKGLSFRSLDVAESSSDGVQLRGRLKFARETRIDREGATPRIAQTITRNVIATLARHNDDWEVTAWSFA